MTDLVPMTQPRMLRRSLLSTALSSAAVASLVWLAPLSHASAQQHNDELVPSSVDKFVHPEATLLPPDDWGQPQATRVLYMNYDGATLTQGPTDDPVQNITFLRQLAQQPLQPFWGTEAESATITQMVAADFAAYQLDIVEERPASGPYNMAIVTATPSPLPGMALGVAQIDCYDAYAGNIAAVFPLIGEYTGRTDLTAIAVSHEVGHSLGLEHVADRTDLMLTNSPGGAPTVDNVFTDACLRIDDIPTCTQQHAEHCPSGQQNSHQALLTLLGPAQGGGDDGGADDGGDNGATDDGGDGADGTGTDGFPGTDGGTDALPPPITGATTGASDDDTGCGCRSSDGYGSFLAMLFLPLFATRRRR